MFLTEAELVVLTGFHQASKQAQQLRAQGIPFHLNRAGHPRVARAIFEGRRVVEQAKPTWSPLWAGNQAGT